MFPWNSLLIDSFITILFFTLFVGGTLAWKPRIWLHDFPPDIQALTPPKTKDEERLTNILGIPFILTLLILPVFLGWNLKNLMGESFTFGTAFAYAYLLMFNIIAWDTVVIDWIAPLLFLDPQNPPFPGTEGAKGYRDYLFHLKGGIKGLLTVGIIFSLFFATVITLFA